MKLKEGETPERHIARIRAERETLSDELVRLEESFPAPDYPAFKLAGSFGRIPFAAGENYYTRFEFNRLLEEGAVRIGQQDLSKIGGITKGLRIAAIASANKVPIHSHSSKAGVNQAATIHLGVREMIKNLFSHHPFPLHLPDLLLPEPHLL